MNRGIVIAGGIIIGVGAITLLVLAFLLVNEKVEKQAIVQEINELKNKLAAQMQSSKVIEIEPAQSKTIVGFTGPLRQG